MNEFLRSQYARVGPPKRLDELGRVHAAGAGAANFGIAIPALALAPPGATVAEVAPHLLDAEPRDAALWPTLFRLWPDWRWGIQPTGDCTRWMQQHLLDVLHAVLWHNASIGRPEARVAGESIYATAKHELYGRYGYDGAGSTGWAVATAAVRYGFLLRKKYEVAGKTYDLRFDHDDRHTNTWSITWGDRDAARVGLPDELEPLAAEHKARDRVLVETPEQSGKLIQAGYATQYCGYTYWAMQRGDDGMGTRFSAGWHALTATGVRWNPDGTVRALWIANTGHGDHVSGPVGPIDVPDVYAACGSWVPRRLLDRVYAAGDCHAHTFSDGWPIHALVDWQTHDYL